MILSLKDTSISTIENDQPDMSDPHHPDATMPSHHEVIEANRHWLEVYVRGYWILLVTPIILWIVFIIVYVWRYQIRKIQAAREKDREGYAMKDVTKAEEDDAESVMEEVGAEGDEASSDEEMERIAVKIPLLGDGVLEEGVGRDGYGAVGLQHRGGLLGVLY